MYSNGHIYSAILILYVAKKELDPNDWQFICSKLSNSVPEQTIRKISGAEKLHSAVIGSQEKIQKNNDDQTIEESKDIITSMVNDICDEIDDRNLKNEFIDQKEKLLEQLENYRNSNRRSDKIIKKWIKDFEKWCERVGDGLYKKLPWIEKHNKVHEHSAKKAILVSFLKQILLDEVESILSMEETQKEETQKEETQKEEKKIEGFECAWLENQQKALKQPNRDDLDEQIAKLIPKSAIKGSVVLKEDCQEEWSRNRKDYQQFLDEFENNEDDSEDETSEDKNDDMRDTPVYEEEYMPNEERGEYFLTDIAEAVEKSINDSNDSIREKGKIFRSRLKIDSLKGKHTLLWRFRANSTLREEQLPLYYTTKAEIDFYKGRIQYGTAYRDFERQINLDKTYTNSLGKFLPFYLLGSVAPDLSSRTIDGHHVFPRQNKQDANRPDIIMDQFHVLLARAMSYSRKGMLKDAFYCFGILTHLALDALVVSQSYILHILSDRYNKNQDRIFKEIRSEKGVNDKDLENEIEDYKKKEKGTYSKKNKIKDDIADNDRGFCDYVKHKYGQTWENIRKKYNNDLIACVRELFQKLVIQKNTCVHIT